MMTSQPVPFGASIAHVAHEHREVLRRFAAYKFAAKMFGKNRHIIDISCGDGFGTWLLAKECGFAHGIATTAELAQMATANWDHDQVKFSDQTNLEHSDTEWDGLVLVPEQTITTASWPLEQFFESCRLLRHDGIAIVALGYFSNDSDKNHFLNQLAPLYFHHRFSFGLPDLILTGTRQEEMVVCCRPMKETP
jgi:hypothetical protein